MHDDVHDTSLNVYIKTASHMHAYKNMYGYGYINPQVYDAG